MTDRRSPRVATRAVIVGAAALLAGVGSYVLLVIVAVGTSPTEFADFAVFWSLAVTLGLGVYFPVEQETAREVAAEVTSGRGLLVTILTFTGLVSLAAAVVAIVLMTDLADHYIAEPSLGLALIAVILASGIQFPVRGLLSGAGMQVGYSFIVGSEGALRIILPLIALAAAAPVEGYGFAVALAAVLAIAPAVIPRDRRWLRRPRVALARFSSRSGRLILAAISIQLLLNSSVLLAAGLQGEGDLAGPLLAALTIARVPVFVYGVAQVLYMPVLARAWGQGDVRAARRMVASAIGGAAAVGMVLVPAMAFGGQWATGLLFGADRVLASEGCFLIGLGVSVYLLAIVASDGTLAMGGHTAVVFSWMAGLTAGVLAAWLIPDPLLRIVLPFLVGSGVAAMLLLAAALRRLVATPVGVHS